jgi:RNA polymerase sigma-70 factor, ECF subfamily
VKLGHPLDEALVRRLYGEARAERWALPFEAFSALVALSVRRAFPDDAPEPRDLQRYLKSLHSEDLAVACACAEGIESAWDFFVREYRPVLYRAADAIDPSGGAREIADSLYGELFGLTSREGKRRSHFHYFHGRSSLATWLRAVLSQRYVDRLRRDTRLEPLPEEDDAQPAAITVQPAEDTARAYIKVMGRVVMAVIAALQPRDRLRLRLYYAQHLTLAEIGRVLREHEATVSRHLARNRRVIRQQVETRLRDEEGMTGEQIEECFASVVQDAGELDIAELLGS